MAHPTFSCRSSPPFIPASPSSRFLSPLTTLRIRPLIRAVSAPEDCNQEECAPEKEVGKVSMEWVAEENTRVTGTFPPMGKRKWTGYVEKDTAGQTNIYSVEPVVYVSESAISSGTAGDSSEGSEQTAAVAVGLALGFILAAGIVLQRVGNNNMSAVESNVAYNGPSLSFYVQKFKSSVIEAPVPELPISVEVTLSSESSSASDTQASDAAIQAVDVAAVQ